ncbi:MAG: hypothetical protein OXG38_13230 [Chloroflexi bacterium]|nr:hypothetical protein [Chloroflexota bacterium]
MRIPRLAIAVLTAALVAGVLATAYAEGVAGRGPDDAPPPPWFETHPTVIIELRVWQNVAREERLWVSARPKGGRWDALGTIPLAWSTWRNWSSGYGEMARHRFDDIAVGGTRLRIWQRFHEPARIYVQVCGYCPTRSDADRRWVRWRPLGKVPLPLDDGPSKSGRYRYGDLDIAVPSNNPGLLADREHLLALRDVLEGDLEEGQAELDWDAGTPTADWEGIVLGGTTPRVTELNLTRRWLTGEIWGWLGDLSELTRLNLLGNRLTGRIPSKLQLLRNLTYLRLDGNDFEGCVPPGLWRATNHDLEYLGLPACGTPAWVSSAAAAAARGGTYRALFFDAWPSGPRTYVLDVPAWRSVRMGVHIGSASTHNPSSILRANLFGIALRIGSGEETWLFLTLDTLAEMERSHYSGCIYDCGRWKSPAALIEQLAASIWVNRSARPPSTSTELVNAIDGEGSDSWGWVWP